MTDETSQPQEQEQEAAQSDDGVAMILEQVEQLVPPFVRDQVARRPFTFVLIGLGVGLFLGAKKGDELLSAGAAMATAALTANLNGMLGREARDQ
ncbi:MAG: hypothetical protein ACSLFQ_03960 [Thermoanaerobaculia bacterium]